MMQPLNCLLPQFQLHPSATCPPATSTEFADSHLRLSQYKLSVHLLADMLTSFTGLQSSRNVFRALQLAWECLSDAFTMSREPYSCYLYDCIISYHHVSAFADHVWHRLRTLLTHKHCHVTLRTGNITEHVQGAV